MKRNISLVVLIVVVCFAGCKHEGSISATIEPTSLTVSLVASDLQQVTIQFTNHSDRDIRILKPLDGSYYSLLMPHYKYSISNEQASELGASAPGLQSRCGNFGYPYSDTNWPDDYIVTIPAGDTKSLDSRPFGPVFVGQKRPTYGQKALPLNGFAYQPAVGVLSRKLM